MPTESIVLRVSTLQDFADPPIKRSENKATIKPAIIIANIIIRFLYDLIFLK